MKHALRRTRLAARGIFQIALWTLLSTLGVTSTIARGSVIVPTFDVHANCNSAAARTAAGSNSTARNTEICFQKEQAARGTLSKDWARFAASDKAICVPLSSQGGSPTYTELLSCLEIVSGARELRLKTR